MSTTSSFALAAIERLTSLSEATLQSQIVEPLLRHLGFTHVRDTSGPNDRGKDLIALKDEFGKSKLYAIQIKKFRFTGKSAHSSALTAALIQIRQALTEPVLDPQTHVSRTADRCIFLTPFAINRHALESAIFQMQELERREVTVIDGVLLVDQILRFAPGLLGALSQDMSYRLHVAQEVGMIPEATAFGLPEALALDDIYVELSCHYASEFLAALRYTTLNPPYQVTELMTDPDLTTLASIGHQLGGTSDLFSSKPAKAPRKRFGMQDATARTAGFVRQPSNKTPQDRSLKREQKSADGSEQGRWLKLNLTGIMQLIGKRLTDFEEQIQTLNDAQISVATRTRTVREGIVLGKTLLSASRHPALKLFLLDRDIRRAPVVPASLLLQLNTCVLISGGPGTGKTTLLRRLAQQSARREDMLLPVLIYLMRLSDVTLDGLLAAILSEIHGRGLKWTMATLRDQLRSGNVRLFFDGLDETGAHAKQLYRSISAMSDMWQQCPIMVSVRDTFGFSAWKGAMHVSLNRFDDDQMHLFLERWFTARPSAARYLWVWLERHAFMKQLAKTPMVATLLCALFESNSDMPNTEVELYEERFELLLGKWEQAKGLQSMPRKVRRCYRRMLTELAMRMHEHEVRRFAFQDAAQIAAKHFVREWNGSANAMVEDCIHRGILDRYQDGSVSFGHLTYQEYLAARGMVEGGRHAQMWEHIGAAWWNNVLRFYAEIKGDVSELLEYCISEDGESARFAAVEKLARIAPVTASASFGRYLRQARKRR